MEIVPYYEEEDEEDFLEVPPDAPDEVLEMMQLELKAELWRAQDALLARPRSQRRKQDTVTERRHIKNVEQQLDSVVKARMARRPLALTWADPHAASTPGDGDSAPRGILLDEKSPRRRKKSVSWGAETMRHVEEEVPAMQDHGGPAEVEGSFAAPVEPVGPSTLGDDSDDVLSALNRQLLAAQEALLSAPRAIRKNPESPERRRVAAIEEQIVQQVMYDVGVDTPRQENEGFMPVFGQSQPQEAEGSLSPPAPSPWSAPDSMGDSPQGSYQGKATA